MINFLKNFLASLLIPNSIGKYLPRAIGSISTCTIFADLEILSGIKC